MALRAVRYLRKSCALEVLSIGIPFEVLAQRSFHTQLLSLFKLLRVQRWFRVRARERHRAHEVGRMPRGVVVEKLSNIALLLIVFLAWSHLTCCICAHHLPVPPPKGLHMCTVCIATHRAARKNKKEDMFVSHIGCSCTP